MTTPTPPVALKDQCSIIHNNTLYVYSPDAFQTLSLEVGAEWKQETNGVSVTGAQCVYGGIDGANNQSALYIVGGVATNDSDYTGLQRYAIADKTWTTITPLVEVTKNRQYHGAAYINSSSGIIVYGGSQEGSTGLSSETFFIELYSPYRVEAYSSDAPPVRSPFVMPWSDDRALMVGGSTTNLRVYTFGVDDGWEDVGLNLTSALPNASYAQAALLSLDDGSKILQTFDLGQLPISVTSDVLLDAGGDVADDGEVVGISTSTAAATATATTSNGTSATTTSTSKIRRSLSLASFPIYNGTDQPTTTRTNFSIAQSEDGLLAFVGGDADSTISFFDQTEDSWIAAEEILGQVSSSSTVSSTSSATATSTQASTSASTHSHRSAILGGVLGGILGALALVAIVLLFLWLARKRKREREQRQSKSGDWAGGDETDEGLQSLSANGQPMGLSPVHSTIITQSRTSAMFVQNPADLVRPGSKGSSSKGSSKGGARLDGHKPSTAQRLFHREKSALAISRPMNPDLGDYSLRNNPNINLGHATPAEPLNSTALFSAVAASNIPTRNKSHRKTDEAWAKYFSNDTADTSPASAQSSGGAAAAAPAATTEAEAAGTTNSAPPRPALRDSNGRPLEINAVSMSSPVLENSASAERTRTLMGQIAMADMDSVYDDEVLNEGFSSGVPSMAAQQRWTPLSDAWPEPAAARAGVKRSETSSPDNASEAHVSAIPNFPMPGSTIRPVRPSLGPGSPLSKLPTSRVPRSKLRHPDDLSWLNLQAQDTS